MAPGSVVVTMENPINFSVVQVEGLDPGSVLEKGRAKNQKQFRWFLLLRAQRAVAFLSWSFFGLAKLLATAQKRLLSFNTAQKPHRMGKLLLVLRAFLLVSVMALVFEIYAHNNELHLIQPWEVQNMAQQAYMLWLSFRIAYVSPLVMSLSRFCIVLFLIQSLDRFVLCFGCFWIKFKKLKPRLQDEVKGKAATSYLPMVLVQIPMCNEREVRVSIVYDFLFDSSVKVGIKITFFFNINSKYLGFFFFFSMASVLESFLFGTWISSSGSILS